MTVHTRFDTYHQTSSLLDLSLCHPSIYMDVACEISSDRLGSDHHPIIITANTSDHPVPERVPKWNFKKAKWDAFQDQCITDGCSIFTAEVEAIKKALTYVKVSTRKSFVIFSDSMSVLQAIESQESKNPLVNRVLQACQKILSNGKFITFCWLPSHRDIRGNDADRAAKDALSKAQPENFDLPCTDVFMKIQPFISSLWQERWDKEVGNKLYAIMPQIDEKYYSGCTNKKDEVIINRLRIGHTRLTHSFRMENRPHPPLCDQCEGDHELTVKHILIECNFLKIIRRRHYDVTDLNQLFKTVSSNRILDFVKDIGLYNSL